MEPTEEQIKKIEKTIDGLKVDIETLVKCSEDLLESQQKIITMVEKLT